MSDERDFTPEELANMEAAGGMGLGEPFYEDSEGEMQLPQHVASSSTTTSLSPMSDWVLRVCRTDSKGRPSGPFVSFPLRSCIDHDRLQLNQSQLAISEGCFSFEKFAMLMATSALEFDADTDVLFAIGNNKRVCLPKADDAFHALLRGRQSVGTTSKGVDGNLVFHIQQGANSGRPTSISKAQAELLRIADQVGGAEKACDILRRYSPSSNTMASPLSPNPRISIDTLGIVTPASENRRPANAGPLISTQYIVAKPSAALNNSHSRHSPDSRSSSVSPRTRRPAESSLPKVKTTSKSESRIKSSPPGLFQRFMNNPFQQSSSSSSSRAKVESRASSSRSKPKSRPSSSPKDARPTGSPLRRQQSPAEPLRNPKVNTELARKPVREPRPKIIEEAAINLTDIAAAAASSSYEEYLGNGLNCQNMTQAEWTTICDFFCIDATKYPHVASAPETRNGIKKLLFTTLKLKDSQLWAVFKILTGQMAVSGAILADSPGLGKSLVILGVVACSKTIRIMKREVEAEWKVAHTESRRQRLHLRPGEGRKGGRCPCRKQYGLECYCEERTTYALAQAIPEDGIVLIVCPSRSTDQFYEQAKRYLDGFEVYLESAYSTDRVPKKELVQASISSSGVIPPGRGTSKVKYTYTPKPKQDSIVVVTSAAFLGNLVDKFKLSATVKIDTGRKIIDPDNGRNMVDLKTGMEIPETTQTIRRRCGLYPSMLIMDEFHEFVGSTVGMEALAAIAGKVATRPTGSFFLSGTPFERNPVSLLPVIEMLEKPHWAEHPSLRYSTVRRLQGISDMYQSLASAETSTNPPDLAFIKDYKNTLDQFLINIMIRRDGADRFRGRTISGLAPAMLVPINCEIPEKYLSTVQLIADESGHESHWIRQPDVERLLVPLRLAASFPAMSKLIAKGNSYAHNFDENDLKNDLRQKMDKDGLNVTRFRMFAHIDEYTQDSPKLSVLLQKLRLMLADTTPRPGAPPGSSSTMKKMVIFCTNVVEAFVVHCWLHHQRSVHKLPVRSLLLHEGMDPAKHDKYVFSPWSKVGAGEANVLVCTTEVAGTGLNGLTVANYGVVFSPLPTLTLTEQVFARLNRQGQELPVHFWQLQSPGMPLDRRILATQGGPAYDTQASGAHTVCASLPDSDSDSTDDAAKGSKAADAYGFNISQGYKR